MANLFDGLYRIALIVLIVLLILTAVVGIGIFLYYRSRKKRRITLKNVDYSFFNRRDAKDYIKIDDIKDDMIITENMTRFIGVIDCQGYDFYSAHAYEQADTAQNYLGFINIIDKQISYRQHSVSVDLEYTVKKYLKAYDDVCEKLEKAIERQNEIQAALNTELSPERKNLYMSELEDTKRQVSAFSFRKFHLEDQLQHIDNNLGSASSPLISSHYVFDWVYNPLEYSVDLTESEILERAKNELAAQTNALIHSLSNCGVKAKRCTTLQLIDMCRRHSQPISSERYRIRDLLNSSYYDDITTSNNSVEKLNEVARKKLSDEATTKLNEEFNDLIKDLEDEIKEDENHVLLSAGRAEGES